MKIKLTPICFGVSPALVSVSNIFVVINVNLTQDDTSEGSGLIADLASACAYYENSDKEQSFQIAGTEFVIKGLSLG